MKLSTNKTELKWMLVLAPFVGLILAFIFMNNMPLGNIKPLSSIIHSIIITSGLWLGCGLIVEVLWKKFPWEQNPIKHLIYEVLFIFLFTNSFSFGLYKLEVSKGFIEESDDIYLGAVITNLITFLITAIYEAIFFYKQWKLHFSKSVKLERDNIEAKYETLKAQINPHFLFNSLNSLTTLVEENQPAVDYIQNLSDFLRYVLKSRDRELVLVRDEVAILVKYISLQKSRFKENLQVVIDIKEEYYHYALPPLVLQMLFENCLKHNIISREKPLTISIKAEKGNIHIENNLQKKNNPESTGNGLMNITERYKFFS